MNHHLVLLDVPAIKKFVFGTDKLVEIRGASALLSRLNEKKTPDLLKEQFGENRVDCVFSGGGAGQFIVEAELERLESGMQTLQRLFFDESKGALNILYGVAEFRKDDYQRSIETAFQDLRRKKEEEAISPASMIHAGFFRECDSCSENASEIVKHAGETRVLCGVCAKKVESDGRKGLWHEFETTLKQYGDNDFSGMMPVDFKEIGDRCRSKEGYVALVYADGNAMGKLIKAIDNKDAFRFFSQTIDRAVKDACHEALYAECKPVDGKIPANILLLGGDDLLVYLAADAALPFVLKAARVFEEKTKECFTADPYFADLLKGKGMTLSFGIAYGRHHTPFSMMFDQAEELLKSAKKGGSLKMAAKGEENPTPYYSPTFIDFHLTSHFNQVKVSDSRNNHLNIGGARPVKITHKPYALEDAEALMQNAKALFESGIPRSRLKRFGHAPFMGKMNGTIECLKLYTRIKKSEQRPIFWKALSDFDCVTNMPWKETDAPPATTMLADLMELVEFCGVGAKKGGDHATPQT